MARAQRGIRAVLGEGSRSVELRVPAQEQAEKSQNLQPASQAISEITYEVYHSSLAPVVSDDLWLLTVVFMFASRLIARAEVQSALFIVGSYSSRP